MSFFFFFTGPLPGIRAGINKDNRKYGDLTSSPTLKSSPLHAFRLRPQPGASKMEMECELPERLDLGISDTGIVGRQVTVVADGRMGMGVVGYD